MTLNWCDTDIVRECGSLCFCYSARFRFSIPSQKIGLGNVSKMTYFVTSGM